MTGWRLGYLAGKQRRRRERAGRPPDHRQRRQRRRPAGRARRARRRPSDAPAQMLEEYAYRRQMLDEILSGADGLSWRKPEGTFYAFVKYAADLPAREMAAFLLDRGVAVRSGTEFGPAGEGHVRLSFATSRENIQRGRAPAGRCRRRGRHAPPQGRRLTKVRLPQTGSTGCTEFSVWNPEGSCPSCPGCPSQRNVAARKCPMGYDPEWEGRVRSA